MISPEGPVYQAGTLSGNPLAVAAGLAQLRTLQDRPAIYRTIEKRAEQLAASFRGVTVNRVGSMLTPFFTRGPVRTWKDVSRCDVGKFGRFHRALRERGILAPPSAFEAWFTSLAHTDGDIRKTAQIISACSIDLV